MPLFRPDGEPPLGMEKFTAHDARATKLFAKKRNTWVGAPNVVPIGELDASRARARRVRRRRRRDSARDVGADLEGSTVPSGAPIRFGPSGSALRDQRRAAQRV